MTRSDAHHGKAPPPRVGKRDYALGAFTAGLLALMLFLFLGYLVGFPEVRDRIRERFSPGGEESVVDLPEDVLRELVDLNAVVSNAGNPTNRPEHDTVLVRPDEAMGYVLRPGAAITGHLLETKRPFNWDPPVLYLKTGLPQSARLRDYVEENARLSYRYSVSEEGFRTTLPEVDSSRRILVVGDSVAFGVGVNDGDTIASCLQRLEGKRFRVVNAAVGGYDGRSVFKAADRLSRDREYWALVYIACQNDFVHGGDDWTAEAREVLAGFDGISDRFGGRVVVCLHTYMEYNLRDVFLDQGWSDVWIGRTEALRDSVPKLCGAFGFGYVDWSRLLEAFGREAGSVFARFALYCDHAHLAPLGNRLVAEELSTRLDALEAGVVRAGRKEG